MTTRSFQLTDALRLRAQTHGESGAAWIRGLDACVTGLERDWRIRVGESLAGGSESLVLNATRADGTPAILKVGLPGSADLAAEARVYRIANGRGYAALLAHDDARNALLLERLGRPIAELGLTIRAQLELICSTLHTAWIALNGANGMMTGAEKARWLADFIVATAATLDQPCDRVVLDRALAFAAARERAHDPANCVLVHGDCHEYNTLLCADALADGALRCKFVDPDGLFADPAYDLGILMRGWNDELLAGDALALGRGRCALLAALTGVDEDAIWQWGFIERVSTGLLLTQLGLPDARDTLAIAEHWAAEEQSP
jgi:streptomycin 6-kinase